MKTRLLFILAIPLMMGTCRAQSNILNLFGNNLNYGSGTAIFTSINAILTSFNVTALAPQWQKEYTEGAAIVTGATQVFYGVWQARSNFGALNVVNISAGAATIITNSIALYNTLHSKNKRTVGGKKTVWNIYYSPFDTKGPAFGFRVARRICS